MKKSLYKLMYLSLVAVVSSCVSLESLTIDYLQPADLSFPKQIKSVGVVNNVSNIPDNKLITDTVPKSEYEIGRKVSQFNGNPVITTESLAEAIAAENYFDEVIICDSALRAKDIFARESTLSTEEVKQLADELQVDLIVALENIQLKETRLITYYPGMLDFTGTVDVKVYPSVTVYLPTRMKPLATINASDSIFWEEFARTRGILHTRLINEEKVIEEASRYAGDIPVKHLVPYWTTANRYYFTGGSVNMRDADIYVRENNWDKAVELWKTEYETKKKKKKLRAACNIALYYEINDNLDEAEAWLNKAGEIAGEVETNFKGYNPTSGELSYHAFIYVYLDQIKNRKEKLNRVKLQMERFNDDSTEN